MSKIPDNLLYTKEHEWVHFEDDTVLVGITDYAQGELGDVVYVELPAVGMAVEASGVMGTIESVKSVSDLFAPVIGQIREINTALIDQPELINQDPYGDGWLARIKVADVEAAKAGLLDAAAYAALVAG